MSLKRFSVCALHNEINKRVCNAFNDLIVCDRSLSIAVTKITAVVLACKIFF